MRKEEYKFSMHFQPCRNMYRKKASYIWMWESEFLHPYAHIQTNRICFSTLSSILWERNKSKVTMLMWRICLKLHIPGSVCGEWAYSSTTVKNVMFNGAPEARYILRCFWIRNGFALYRFNTRWAYCLLIFLKLVVYVWDLHNSVSRRSSLQSTAFSHLYG